MFPQLTKPRSNFDALLDDLAERRDYLEFKREVATLGRRARDGADASRQRLTRLSAGLATMAKSTASEAAKMKANNRAAQRVRARRTLADISARATAAAASGQLTAEQAAILDGLIARAEERVGQL